jgi:branched-chain amino acid aminotransferase
MEEKMEIKFIKAESLKQKPDFNNLGFGKYFSDYMFEMDYEEGKGWHNAVIKPYSPISLDPSAMVFHYGQAIFEGMKAYKTKDKKILLFRPIENMLRVNISNDRICIPEIDVDFCVEAVKKLVAIEESWIPTVEGTSLYIRPFIIATDPFLGVRASSTYKFMVILSPVGAYYPEGLNPVKIYVEENYVRAVKGGTGFAKTPGNYAASLKSQIEAKKKGYTQVLWLDGVERKYIEEVGTMNVFFKIGKTIITPSLDGSILPGITRKSSIEVLKSWGLPVEERKISIEEVIEAAKTGELKEVFGTGTAAVISPVGEIIYKGEKISINNGKIGDISKKLYDTITGIQSGELPDEYNWTVEVK